MTTKIRSHKSASHANGTEETALAQPAPALSADPAPAPAEASSTAHVAAPAPVTPGTGTAPPAGTTTSLQFPPKDARIPPQPGDYVAPAPGVFRNVVPRQSELTALPQALIDLREFADYASVLGGAAPSYAELMEAMQLGYEWSVMRQATSKWDAYCVLEEGLAWEALRMMFGRLAPIFAVAVLANPKLATRFRGLATLLGAKQAIAKKAVSTRRLNKQAIAEGKPPVHGVVGKRRQRKAARALLAAANAPAGQPANGHAAGAVATEAPAAPVPALATATPQVNGAGGGGQHG